MNTYYIALMGCLTLLSLSSISAEDFVMVKAPCLEKNGNGDCMRWGVISRGCKAPAGGRCTVDYTYDGKRAICNAENGASCSQTIKLN